MKTKIIGFKTEKAFFKEYDKRYKKLEKNYCMEDFAFDLFEENLNLKKEKEITNKCNHSYLEFLQSLERKF